MSPQPLDSARNADLPASFEALKRAAQRAREVARQTGTPLVIGENGEVRLIDPPPESAAAQVNEPASPYGEDA
ncbi:MAG TPA: hypothetical protein PKE41_02765 [Candidatus Macondimonas sp.]|nr:hypothetical protein [Candidatus Macondimonas sp.]